MARKNIHTLANAYATLGINPTTPNSYIAMAPSILTVKWPQGNTSLITVRSPTDNGSPSGPF